MYAASSYQSQRRRGFPGSLIGKLAFSIGEDENGCYAKMLVTNQIIGFHDF